MKKDSFNSKFIEHARKLSPQQNERDLIGKIYQSINDLLGVNNCIQIGSYPRFTSVTPVHDLDVLYFLGSWNENSHDPLTALQGLYEKIKSEYKNPTNYKINIDRQTHSITISYLENIEDIFSVDIVPAYTYTKNEFGDDTYRVPEIITTRHSERFEYYQNLMQKRIDMGWITSDPRGYIKIASDLDKLTSGVFRKSVKLIKLWKNNLADRDETLKLKSFHIEQVIVDFLKQNSNFDVFDVVYKFFAELPNIINSPNRIKDRADNNKFIDDYLERFTKEQIEKFKITRDGFLIKLENLKDSDSIKELCEINFLKRMPTEQFLFDSSIKVLTDPSLKMKIDGFVKAKDGFSPGWINETPQFQRGITSGGGGRKIEFSIKSDNTNANEYRWKVRNCDNSPQPRGEICINRTKNSPEHTQFPSDSFVECYAISNNICVARARVNVKIV